MRGARGIAILAALAAICVFLAGGLVSALGPPEPPPPPDFGAPADAPRPPEIPVFTGPELDDLTEAMERPPFSESRRPAAAPALPSAPAPQTLDATLSGVIFSADDRVAILSSSDDGEAVRLREGDVFLGWTLVQVQVDQVLLERDGRQKRLQLDFKAAPPVARETERERAVERNRLRRRELREAREEQQAEQDEDGEQQQQGDGQ